MPDIIPVPPRANMATQNTEDTQQCEAAVLLCGGVKEGSMFLRAFSRYFLCTLQITSGANSLAFWLLCCFDSMALTSWGFRFTSDRILGLHQLKGHGWGEGVPLALFSVASIPKTVPGAENRVMDKVSLVLSVVTPKPPPLARAVKPSTGSRVNKT